MNTDQNKDLKLLVKEAKNLPKLNEKQVFEIYYLMGEKRSLPQLYEIIGGKIGMPRLSDWNGRYYWQIRVRDRDHVLRQENPDVDMVNLKKELWNAMVNTVRDQMFEKNGKSYYSVIIESPGDLEKMIKMILTLSGEPTEITQVRIELVEIVVQRIVSIVRKYLPETDKFGDFTNELREVCKVRSKGMHPTVPLR